MLLTKCLLQAAILSTLLAVSCLGITITVDDDDPCADFDSVQGTIEVACEVVAFTALPAVLRSVIWHHTTVVVVQEDL